MDLILRRLTSNRTVAGAFAIAAVVLVTYYPVVQSGFHNDDWGLVEAIGRLGVWEFIVRSFNPFEPSFLNTYRPLQGVETAIAFSLFGTNAIGYHLLNIALHIVNGLLLSAVVWAVTRRSSVALLAGLFYSSMAVYSVAVFLPSAADALATAFCLAALWSWTAYARNGKWWTFALTHALFVLGLLSKEFVAILPAALFCVDRVTVGTPTRIAVLLRRYFTLTAILLLYLAFEMAIAPLTVNYQSYGMAIGPHILVNLQGYLWPLVFPWPIEIPYISFWGCLVLLLVAFVAVRNRSGLLAFAGSLMFLGIAPVAGLVAKFDFRFLYFPGAAVCMVWAWFAGAGVTWLRGWRFTSLIIASSAVCLVLLGSVGVSNAAADYAAEAYAWRTPFRDISQRHATFPKGSYVYFIRSPFWTRMLSGMFFVRYRDNVTVGATNRNDRAELEIRSHAFIYYFDDTGRPIEIQVQSDTETQASLALPASFDGMIELEGYELSTSRPARGQDLAILLYWRATRQVDADYQVFVHLIHDGNSVAGVDAPPGGGPAGTSSWYSGLETADGVVLSVPSDLTPDSGYSLEIGLYDLATMRRLSIHNEQGAWVSDKVVIEGITVH